MSSVPKSLVFPCDLGTSLVSSAVRVTASGFTRRVSSVSWYFLNVFGLRSIYSLILGADNGMCDPVSDPGLNSSIGCGRGRPGAETSSSTLNVDYLHLRTCNYVIVSSPLPPSLPPPPPPPPSPSPLPLIPSPLLSSPSSPPPPPLPPHPLSCRPDPPDGPADGDAGRSHGCRQTEHGPAF